MPFEAFQRRFVSLVVSWSSSGDTLREGGDVQGGPQEQLHNESDHGFGHVRVYTLDECVELAEETGLEAVVAQHLHDKSLAERLRHGTGRNNQSPSAKNRVIAGIYHIAISLLPSARPRLFLRADKPTTD